MIFLTEYSQNSFFARFSTFVSPEKIKVEKVISSICKRTTGQFICRRFTNPCLVNTGFFTMKTKSALYLKYNFNSKSTLRISSEKIASSGVLYSWNASCRDSFVFFFFFCQRFSTRRILVFYTLLCCFRWQILFSWYFREVIFRYTYTFLNATE